LFPQSRKTGYFSACPRLPFGRPSERNFDFDISGIAKVYITDFAVIFELDHFCTPLCSVFNSVACYYYGRVIFHTIASSMRPKTRNMSLIFGFAGKSTRCRFLRFPAGGGTVGQIMIDCGGKISAHIL